MSGIYDKLKVFAEQKANRHARPPPRMDLKEESVKDGVLIPILVIGMVDHFFDDLTNLLLFYW